jgi:BlaI family penicillinase repressor
MPAPKLSKLELQIMDKLWAKGEASTREIQEAFPSKGRPGYTTIQMTMYRMELKKVIRRVRKVGNFYIFEALVSRDAAQQRLVDELVSLFGGRSQLVMSHLVKSGKLKLEDVREAEKELLKLEEEERPQ